MELLLGLIGLLCLIFTGQHLVKGVISDIKKQGFKARWKEVREVSDRKEQGYKFFHVLFKLVCNIGMAIVVVVTAVLVVIGFVKRLIG